MGQQYGILDQDTLMSWGEENGSELLKLRIQERAHFEWKELAREEWLLSLIKGSDQFLGEFPWIEHRETCDESAFVKRPKLNLIERWCAVKKALGVHLTAASLARVRYGGDSQYEMRVDVITLDGEEHTFDLVIGR